MFGFAY